MDQFRVTFRTAEAGDIIDSHIVTAHSAKVAFLRAYKGSGLSNGRTASFNVQIVNQGRVLRIVRREWHPPHGVVPGRWSFHGDEFIPESQPMPEGWELESTWRSRRREREA